MTFLYLLPSFSAFSLIASGQRISNGLFDIRRLLGNVALPLHVGVGAAGGQHRLLRAGDHDSGEGAEQLDAQAESEYE